MDEIDRELELRVWQRVRGGQQLPELEWQAFSRQELAGARELELLAGRFRGRNRELLLKLAEQEYRHGKMLARRLGMPLPRKADAYRKSGGSLERLEAVAEQLRSRAERYSDSAVRNPTDDMLKMLAKEERQTFGQLMALIGQLRR